MGRVCLRLCIIGISVVVFAGAFFAFYIRQAHMPSLPPNFQLVRRSSGGFDGGGQYPLVTITSTTVLMGDAQLQQVPLTSAQIAELSNRVERLNFFALADSYPEEPTCADAYVTTISLR